MRWNFQRSTALMKWEASSCTLVYIISAPSDKQWCHFLVAQRLTHGRKDSCKVGTPWELHGASFILCYSHLVSQQMVGVQRKVDKSMNVYYRCFCSNPVHAFLVPCTMLPWKSPGLGKYQDGDRPLAVYAALRSTERSVRDLLMSWGWRLPQLALNIRMGATMEMGQCGTSRVFVLLRQCELGQLLDSGALKGGDRRLCNLPRARKPRGLTAQSSGQRALHAASLYKSVYNATKKASCCQCTSWAESVSFLLKIIILLTGSSYLGKAAET